MDDLLRAAADDPTTGRPSPFPKVIIGNESHGEIATAPHLSPHVRRRLNSCCPSLSFTTKYVLPPKADIGSASRRVRFVPKVDIHRSVPMRVDPGLHKPADIVTCPVLYNPMARAAAGDRSMSLPRTHGLSPKRMTFLPHRMNIF